jgi:uncharacterized protein (DUF433 family)
MLMSHSFIKTDPQILGGTPCFAGTRVPVKSFFDHLKLDYSIDEFLEQFPSVERIQIEQLLAELEGETVVSFDYTEWQRTLWPEKAVRTISASATKSRDVTLNTTATSTVDY